ncbi:MAG: hypothetical protein OXC19_03090 [Bryobacterales bacterium]|nr:hypothetical protein [Bryobacterales bacterium]
MRKPTEETYGQLVQQGAIEPEHEEAVRRVYSLVPLDGTRTTQHQITLEMPESERASVADHITVLKDGGLVSTDRGAARPVWRRPCEYSNEHSLYPHMRAEIATRWADEWPHDYDEPDRFCEVLATHGAKRGGRWAAPDITLIGGKTLRFLPGKFLDVVTFEVKPELDITGLYEALSHRTHATHAYLLCHHPKSRGEPDPGLVGRISREATRTGVGFILARQPDDYATWEEIVPATRWSPEPEFLHDFVAGQDKNALRRLRRWLQANPFLGERPEVDFSALGLDVEDQRRAEDIYCEIPVNRSVGWKHFQGWIDRADVERIRQKLKEAGIIRVVQAGGMILPNR